MSQINKNDSINLNTYHDVVCIYCNKVFKLNNRDMRKGKKVCCAWCGGKHINTSNKNFKLKKIKTEE